MAIPRPQVGIERLPTRRMSNEPRESMNCKSCRKRKVSIVAAFTWAEPNSYYSRSSATASDHHAKLARSFSAPAFTVSLNLVLCHGVLGRRLVALNRLFWWLC